VGGELGDESTGRETDNVGIVKTRSISVQMLAWKHSLVLTKSLSYQVRNRTTPHQA